MGTQPPVDAGDDRAATAGDSGARRLSPTSRHALLPTPSLGVPAGPRRGTPPALAVAGGALLAAAAGGAWVRETVVTEAGTTPEIAAETLGWQVTGAPVLAVLGLLLVCSGPLWVSSGARVRRLLAGISALAVIGAVVVLVRLQDTIGTGVAAAIESADVAARHVGVGWGAWAAATGAAACALAAVTELVTPAGRRQGVDT